jgi:hypothetical protein
MAFSARRWRTPDTITVFGTVADSDVPRLRTQLSQCESGLRLDQLSMVHCVRLFVVDADCDLRGRPLPARLILSAVFDGPVEDFLVEWVELAGDTLVDLLGLCVDGPADREGVVRFIRERAVLPNTFHIGTVRSSVTQIREEQRLADELRAFVDSHFAVPGSATSAEEVRSRALDFVRSRPDLPQQPRAGRTLLSWVLQAADFARAALVMLGLPLAVALVYTLATGGGWITFVVSLVVALAVAGGLAVGVVRYLERTEPDVVVRQDDAKVKALEEVEDLYIQNQFTMVAAVRDSIARRLILRVTLFLSDEFSKHFSTAGRLVGVETIHFARIHQFDAGRRFLFMSDFDGGWNRYLFDFLTTGAFAVVPNWTNLVGCPKTRYLLVPGHGFTQRFLPFTRARQVGSDVWYSAFPNLTVHDVLNHAEIRNGLFSNRAGDAEPWVRRL